MCSSRLNIDRAVKRNLARYFFCFVSKKIINLKKKKKNREAEKNLNKYLPENIYILELWERG